MTNAEKFKEFFGFENGDTNTCPYKDCIDKDSENYDSCDECIEAYWRSEYQGEPTIPLSVIEKIHDAIDNADSDGFLINKNGHMLAMTLTKEHVNEIIDNAVSEVEK